MDIEATNTTTETLSPEKYLQLTEVEKANIDQTKIIPPLLGDEGFGKIQVSYRVPVYRVIHE